ncbi:MAG: hypothetical protein ACPGZU_11375 [Ketobacter sp.]
MIKSVHYLNHISLVFNGYRIHTRNIYAKLDGSKRQNALIKGAGVGVDIRGDSKRCAFFW